MEFLVTIMVIVIILFAICLYALYNILVKYEESDDETGYVFEQIKHSMDNINKKYNIDGTQEKG